jgi:hypothetical protein
VTGVAEASVGRLATAILHMIGMIALGVPVRRGLGGKKWRNDRMVDSRPGDIFQPGELLNNTYRVESILGRGGTSEVYRARNEISGRPTAVKVLKQEFSGDEAFITLMRREEAIREIRHDAIVRYSENHRTPSGLVYLLMDYVEGPALDKLMKEGGMSAPDLIDVCRRVSDGLRAAHSRRIIHRDLSPDNIILRDGIPSEAVIIDFGIAKDTNPGAETVVGNEFAGKYAYAAPEQLSGKTDTRSDLYALGALLLATFRGKRPDPGANPMEVIRNKQLPLDTEGVPEPLKGLIDRLTKPDPAERFQSADEVLRAIDGDAYAETDRTILAPGSASASDGLRPTTVLPRTTTTPQMATPAIAATTPAKGSKGGLWVALIVGIAVLGGGAAWVSGALGPKAVAELPVAEPYVLTIEKTEAGVVTASGNVPSEQVSTDLAGAVTALGGTANLMLASGEVGASWGTDVLSVLAQVSKLDSWKIELSGNTAKIAGATGDQGTYDAVTAALGTALPGTLKGKADITLTEGVLAVDAVNAVLAEQADCGPLTLLDPPAEGYGVGDTITVTGNLSGALKQVELVDALNAIAGNRVVSLRLQFQNADTCQG